MNSTTTDKNASTHTASTREEIAAISTGARVEFTYQPQRSTHSTQTFTGTVVDRRDKKSGDFWKLTIDTGGGKMDVWVNGSVHKRTSYAGYPDDVQKVGTNACVEVQR